jgi:hypothetical protein
MAILDGFLCFSSTPPGDLPTAIASNNSSNVIDLHMAGIPVLANLQGARDMGIGDDPALKLLVQVTATFTSGGALTLSVALQGATDNGAGAPAAFSTWWASPVYALATLVTGARLLDMDMPRPPAGIAIPRFLRMQYIIAGAVGTAGSVFAAIVLDRHDQAYQSTSNATLGGYPAGINVAN